MKISSDVKLQIDSTCSVGICSRNRNILGKPVQLKFELTSKTLILTTKKAFLLRIFQAPIQRFILSGRRTIIPIDVFASSSLYSIEFRRVRFHRHQDWYGKLGWKLKHVEDRLLAVKLKSIKFCYYLKPVKVSQF